MQVLRARWLKSCFGQPADDAAAAKSKDCDCDKSPSKPPATALGDALDTKASGGDVVTDALATAYEIVCSSASPPTQHAHTSNTNPAQATVSAQAGRATGYAPRPAEPTASDPLDAIQTALPALPEVQGVQATFVTNTSRRRSTQLPVRYGPIDSAYSAEAFPVPIARRPPCARRSFSHRTRDGPAVLRDASCTLQSRHSFTLSRNGSLQRSSPLAHMLNPVSPFNNALVALVKCSGEQVTGNMSPRLQRWCEIAEAIRSNSVTGTSPRPSAVRAKQVLLEEAEQLQQLQLQVQA